MLKDVYFTECMLLNVFFKFCLIWVIVVSMFTSYYQYGGNISSIFSSNSEAKASELLENIEEMLPLYYMHSDYLTKLSQKD